MLEGYSADRLERLGERYEYNSYKVSKYGGLSRDLTVFLVRLAFLSWF